MGALTNATYIQKQNYTEKCRYIPILFTQTYIPNEDYCILFVFPFLLPGGEKKFNSNIPRPAFPALFSVLTFFYFLKKKKEEE
jgi:hypothetical protein